MQKISMKPGRDQGSRDVRCNFTCLSWTRKSPLRSSRILEGTGIYLYTNEIHGFEYLTISVSSSLEIHGIRIRSCRLSTSIFWTGARDTDHTYVDSMSRHMHDPCLFRVWEKEPDPVEYGQDKRLLLWRNPGCRCCIFLPLLTHRYYLIPQRLRKLWG